MMETFDRREMRRLAEGGQFPGETAREPGHLIETIGFVVALFAIGALLLLLAPSW